MTPRPLADEQAVSSQQPLGLPLSLFFALLLHLLFFLALPASPPVKRGADAAAFQIDLWPATAEKPVEVLPMAAEPAPFAAPAGEASRADISAEATERLQENPVERNVPLPVPTQTEEANNQPVQRKSGCLGPEEMARLQAQRDNPAPPGAEPGEGLSGFPCVEG